MEPQSIEDDGPPGPSDLDPQGRCWWGHGIISDSQTGEPYSPTWSLADRPWRCDTHWLPAHALPVAPALILTNDDAPDPDEDFQEALTAAERNPSLCR